MCIHTSFLGPAPSRGLSPFNSQRSVPALIPCVDTREAGVYPRRERSCSRVCTTGDDRAQSALRSGVLGRCSCSERVCRCRFMPTGVGSGPLNEKLARWCGQWNCQRQLGGERDEQRPSGSCCSARWWYWSLRGEEQKPKLDLHLRRWRLLRTAQRRRPWSLADTRATGPSRPSESHCVLVPKNGVLTR